MGGVRRRRAATLASRAEGAGSLATWVIGTLISFVAFYPSLVSGLVSPRLAFIIAVTVLVASVSAGSRANARRVLLVVTVGLYASLGTLVSGQIASFAADPLLATNLQRLFIVTPVLFFAGMKLYGTLAGFVLAKSYVLVAIPTAILAVAEAVLGRSLFGRQAAFAEMMRDGGMRAILAADHALVLGAMLAVAVPLAALLKPRPRLAVVLLLTAGVAATGSRGPLAFAALFALLCVSPSLLLSLKRYHAALRAIVIFAVILLGYLATSVWTTDVTGSTGADYSTNYRWAIYASLPEFLGTEPWGYGLGTFPSGVWLAQSEIFGVRDILATLDSELVYSGFTLGWIGVGLVVAALLIAVAAIRHDTTIGLAATLLSILGFALALHAWDGLGALWLLLTGGAASAIRQQRVRARESSSRSARRVSRSRYGGDRYSNIQSSASRRVSRSGRAAVTAKAGREL